MTTKIDRTVPVTVPELEPMTAPNGMTVTEVADLWARYGIRPDPGNGCACLLGVLGMAMRGHDRPSHGEYLVTKDRLGLWARDAEDGFMFGEYPHRAPRDPDAHAFGVAVRHELQRRGMWPTEE